MTENEIKELLTLNRSRGVCFMFLPHDVQEWIFANKDKVCVLEYDGEWTGVHLKWERENSMDAVFTLIDDAEFCQNKKKAPGKGALLILPLYWRIMQ